MVNLMARHILPSLLVAFAIACSGGGDGTPAATGDALTAQEILGNCVAFDAADLASLLEMLQGTLTGAENAPGISLDILGGIVGGGVFPYGVDLDTDGTDDITGTIHFTDGDGAITIPFDLDQLDTLDPNDPLGLLAAIRDGTTLHMSFLFDSLVLESGNGADGEGEFSLLIDGGAIGALAGEATFGSGDCVFDLSFSELTLGELEPGAYPVATVDYSLDAVDGKISGSVVLDGTSVARVSASLDGAPAEVFTVDLASGGLLG